jgi:hypothetical protein
MQERIAHVLRGDIKNLFEFLPSLKFSELDLRAGALVVDLTMRHIFLTGRGHEVLFCLRDRLSANVFGTNYRVHSSNDRARAGDVSGGVVAPHLWKTELA